MGISKDSVVYTDCTIDTDVLSASPARNNGVVYGTLAVTHGADFSNGTYDNSGRTQSICVKPGEELVVIAALGDRLRGVNAYDPDPTLVTSESELRVIGEMLGIPPHAMDNLVDRLTRATAKKSQLA